MTVEMLNKKLENLEAEIKESKKLNEDIKNLCVEIKGLTVEMKYMRELQDKQEQRITNLEQQPVKKYDSIVTTIITGVVAAVVGAIMAVIGLKK